jgi:hypothetical protein
VADQLAAKQAVGHDQAVGEIHVKTVLEIAYVGVAIVDEFGIDQHDHFIGVVAGQDALLIAGKCAVLNDQAGPRDGNLIADAGTVAA